MTETIVTPLTHVRAIDKGLVHKLSIDQVFLTDYRIESDSRAVLAGVLPSSHSFYNDWADPGTVDFAALLEICRQACFVIGHQQQDIPLGVQFLLQEIDAESSVGDTALPRPREVMLDCQTQRISGRTFAWSFSVTEASTARVLFTARFRQIWVEKPRWMTIRAKMRTDRGFPVRRGDVPQLERVSPGLVGRFAPGNVIVGAGVRAPGGWTVPVAADLTHATLFDHPMDHLYAMFQFEAVRQAIAVSRAGMGAGAGFGAEVGVGAGSTEVVGYRGRFERIAEYDCASEILIVPVAGSAPVDRALPARLAATVQQHGLRCSEHEIVLRA